MWGVMVSTAIKEMLVYSAIAALFILGVSSIVLLTVDLFNDGFFSYWMPIVIHALILTFFARICRYSYYKNKGKMDG